MQNCAFPLLSTSLTWLNGTSAKKNGTLKEEHRFTINWRVVPALVPMVVCLIGIAASLYWECYFLTLPFGVGILFSLYPIYISYIWKDLQSFSASNKIFVANNIQFKGNIDLLKGELDKTRKENDDFKANNEELVVQRQKLVGEISQLADQNGRLETISRGYEMELGSFKEQSARLEVLGDTFVAVNEKATKNSGEFDSAIEKLKEEVTALATEGKGLQETSQISKGHAEILESTLTKAIKVLQSVSEWKKAKKVRQDRVKMLNETQENIERSVEKLTRLNISIEAKEEKQEKMVAKLEKLCKECQEQTDALEKARTTLNAILESTSSATQTMKKGAEDHVSKVSKVLEELYLYMGKSKKHLTSMQQDLAPSPLKPHRPLSN